MSFFFKHLLAPKCNGLGHDKFLFLIIRMKVMTNQSERSNPVPEGAKCRGWRCLTVNISLMGPRAEIIRLPLWKIEH